MKDMTKLEPWQWPEEHWRGSTWMSQVAMNGANPPKMATASA